MGIFGGSLSAYHKSTWSEKSRHYAQGETPVGAIFRLELAISMTESFSVLHSTVRVVLPDLSFSLTSFTVIRLSLLFESFSCLYCFLHCLSQLLPFNKCPVNLNLFWHLLYGGHRLTQ